MSLTLTARSNPESLNSERGETQDIHCNPERTNPILIGIVARAVQPLVGVVLPEILDRNLLAGTIDHRGPTHRRSGHVWIWNTDHHVALEYREGGLHHAAKSPWPWIHDYERWSPARPIAPRHRPILLQALMEGVHQQAAPLDQDCTGPGCDLLRDLVGDAPPEGIVGVVQQMVPPRRTKQGPPFGALLQRREGKLGLDPSHQQPVALRNDPLET